MSAFFWMVHQLFIWHLKPMSIAYKAFIYSKLCFSDSRSQKSWTLDFVSAYSLVPYHNELCILNSNKNFEPWMSIKKGFCKQYWIVGFVTFWNEQRCKWKPGSELIWFYSKLWSLASILGYNHGHKSGTTFVQYNVYFFMYFQCF